MSNLILEWDDNGELLISEPFYMDGVLVGYKQRKQCKAIEAPQGTVEDED